MEAVEKGVLASYPTPNITEASYAAFIFDAGSDCVLTWIQGYGVPLGGIPTRHLAFVGWLPQKKKKKMAIIEATLTVSVFQHADPMSKWKGSRLTLEREIRKQNNIWVKEVAKREGWEANEMLQTPRFSDLIRAKNVGIERITDAVAALFENDPKKWKEETREKLGEALGFKEWKSANASRNRPIHHPLRTGSRTAVGRVVCPGVREWAMQAGPKGEQIRQNKIFSCRHCDFAAPSQVTEKTTATASTAEKETEQGPQMTLDNPLDQHMEEGEIADVSGTEGPSSSVEGAGHLAKKEKVRETKRSNWWKERRARTDK
ncbi:hypothetical protein NLI96_g6084 [Meripilus lineatus]|uniref:Uncharacterized protein n=1 Tax=Meripilus lineatus TaxID=2056292 RepID=A0AAD5YE85_9APHY|nr:hypothetical protein NLI96_g6084 [Physisporinus lineatus]